MADREILFKGTDSEVYLDEIGQLFHIRGIIMGSNDREIHMMFPDSDLPGCVMSRINPSVEDWLKWLKQSDDPVLRITDFDKTVVKAIVRKSLRQVEGNVQWEVYRRDNYTCQYCGAKDRPLTVDHYLAQDFGGQTTVDNLKTACRRCNKIKANMTIEQWENYRTLHNLKG